MVVPKGAPRMDRLSLALSDPSPATLAVMALMIGLGCATLWAR